MENCYDMIKTIINETNFGNAKKMNCAFMFIISNYYGIKCDSHLLQLEPCNDMCKVISDIMEYCNDMWNTLLKQ